MYIYLSKILPLLILPVGMVTGLCLLALVLLWAGKRKTSGALIFCAVLVLWGSSMRLVANTLYGKLEQVYPPVQVLDIPASKCIVLLGGAVEPVMSPRVDFDLHDSVDRVRKAANLYRAGKAELIIVAGGNQPWTDFLQTEAQATEVLLMEWGVPATAIKLEGGSRNTRENAVNSAPLLEEYECGTPLLVTSAAHMPRSVRSFQAIGIDVFPVSTDVRVIHQSEMTVMDVLPNADALNMTSDAMREWIGQKLYAFRGWN